MWNGIAAENREIQSKVRLPFQEETAHGPWSLPEMWDGGDAQDIHGVESRCEEDRVVHHEEHS